MKKRLILLIPALLGMFISACSSSAPAETSSQPQPSSETKSETTSQNPSEENPSSEGLSEEEPSEESSENTSEDQSETSIDDSSIEFSEQQSESSETTRYLITFIDKDGNTIDSRLWDEGSVPACSYTVTDTDEWDYTFLGWSLTEDGEVITIPEANEDATYYAIVNKVKKQYTITFESNGGSSVSPITVDYGTSVNEPTKPTRDEYKFVAWSTDQQGHNKVEWPLTVVKNLTLYANWNEKVNLKPYFQALMGALNQDPYSYIPDEMKPDNTANHVEESDVTYDFANFTNVSDINYGGFGEQWHMVIENIKESERFYSVLLIGEAAIDSSVVLFNNYLDSNPDDTASHSLNETTYTAKLTFNGSVLAYTIQYKTGLSIPFFGEVLPQVDITYDIQTLERAVRIQLSENNAMKYTVSDNHYVFAIEYGVETVSRKAYFEIERDEDDDSVTGHIYEFVQFKEKDLVPACADFYIDEDYVSVVGNKASGLIGFTGYINELYKTDEGRLIGYKVKETFSKWGFEKTYNTLWFNLNNISGINSVKAISNGGVDPHENNHDIYLNGSESIFEPVKNKVAIINTSRRYDVEMRKQFFYGYEAENIVEYETSIPMMFIQDDGTESGETNYSTFENDILSKNGIAASVNLANNYLSKIREDYLTLIDAFIENKEDVDGNSITAYIGDAIVIE